MNRYPMILLVLFAGFLSLSRDLSQAKSTGSKTVPLGVTKSFATGATPAEKNANIDHDDAQTVLRKARGAIFQIKTLPTHGTTPISHGSAFLVGKEELALTNFHVVSTFLHKPANHRLTFESTDSTSGIVTLVAVDVANDLALIQLENVTGSPLTFVEKGVEKGVTVYSIGFPLNVGFSVTKGLFNGYVKGAVRPLVHYSGALNPGMSGGPTLNGGGQVVGVNVSGFRFSQLVNFLVPAKEARALIRRATSAGRKKPSPEKLLRLAQQQVGVYATNFVSNLKPATKVQDVLGYNVPLDFAPFIECSSKDRDPSGRARMKGLSLSCRNNGSVQLQPGLRIAHLSFSHTVLHSKALGAWRFAKQLSENAGAAGAGTGLFMLGGGRMRLYVGPYRCHQRTAAMKGFDAKVGICARAHRDEPKLYDFQIHIVSLNGRQRGLVSNMRLSGAPFDKGFAFVERFLRAYSVQRSGNHR